MESLSPKAEEGDAVAVGAVVCLIDTGAAKPEGGAVPAKENQKQKRQKLKLQKQLQLQKNYATQAPSPAARKILEEKKKHRTF